MSNKNKPGRFKIIITKAAAAALVLAILGTGGFWLYVKTQTRPAEADYLAMIMADESVSIIEERNHFIIRPANVRQDLPTVIYYPGGLVAPEAYLYKMGHTATCLQTNIYIIKAPFNAAIFDVNAAGRIIDKYDLEKTWVGGHSLGGISACRFTAGNPENVFGLFIFGSYCDQDIGGFEGPVISVMGLQDGVINRDNYRDAKQNLPLNAAVLEFEGLNHSDFGNYGLQDNDGPSSLSDDEVIEIICNVFRTNY